MRRLVLLALVFMLAAPAASAKAPTVKTNLIEGFFYYSFAIKGSNAYVLDRAGVYDSDPGTVARLSCVDGAPSCPFVAADAVTDSGRYADLLNASFKRHVFRRGDEIQLSRTHPDGRRVVSRFRMTATGFSRTERTCTLGDGSPTACVLDCPIGTSPTLPCSAVTRKPKLLPKSVFVDWHIKYAKNGDTRFDKLTLVGLPPGTSVFLLCLDRTLDTPCRKYIQFFPPTPAGAVFTYNLTALVAGRSLPPGTTLTLRIRAPGYRRQEIRYTTRKNKLPTRKTLCLDPGVDAARRC